MTERQRRERAEKKLEPHWSQRSIAARALRRLMEELSECCWCAAWKSNLEAELWELALAGGGEYGQMEISEETAKDLLELADAAGGWWAWSEEENDLAVIPLERWRTEREKERGDKMKRKMGPNWLGKEASDDPRERRERELLRSFHRSKSMKRRRALLAELAKTDPDLADACFVNPELTGSMAGLFPDPWFLNDPEINPEAGVKLEDWRRGDQ